MIPPVCGIILTVAAFMVIVQKIKFSCRIKIPVLSI